MRRHEIAVGFRQAFGDESWSLLQRLRQQERPRYIAAIESIARGRAYAVARALEVWAADSETVALNADEVAEESHSADAPPEPSGDPLLDLWQAATDRQLPDGRRNEFKDKARALGLYQHAVELLEEASWHAIVANREGHLLLVEWAVAVDAIQVRRAPPATEADLDWRRGSASAALHLRANQTESEREVGAILRHGIDGLTFTAQVVIGNYIADFACDQLPIVLEVDGSSHRGRERQDEKRDRWFASQGYTTIRISAFAAAFQTEIVAAVRDAANEIRCSVRRAVENAKILRRGGAQRSRLWACRRCSRPPFRSQASPDPVCYGCGQPAYHVCHTCRRTAAAVGSRCRPCYDAWAVAKQLGF